MWGLLVPGSNASAELRSTPTHVGFTPPCCSHGRRSAVHPHVRGVYFAFTAVRRNFAGPSPRAWGLLLANNIEIIGPRSIPTCVGFTYHYDSSCNGGTVHPHVRGVYSISRSEYSRMSGPSPRAWGLPLEVDVLHVPERSIPTCVGFTHSSG